MLKILIAIMVNLTFNAAFGQNKAKVDSLLNVLKQQADTIKVNTLNELAWELRKNDPIAAIDYADTAKAMSNSLDYAEGYLTSLNRLGAIYIYQKDPDRAERIYSDILEREMQRGNDYGIGRAYNQLGLIYTQKGELRKALDYLLNAEERFERLAKRSIVAITSNNIGDLYRQLGDYDNAMSYFLKSLDLKQAQGNQEAMAQTLQNIGLFQLELKNHESALEYLNRSKIIFEQLTDGYELSKVHKNIGAVYFKMAKLDSALFFFNGSIELGRKFNLNDQDSDIYNNIGVIYHKKGLYNEALQAYGKAIQINPTIEVYNNIGHIHYQNGDYSLSREFYGKALGKAEESGQRLEVMNALDNLSDVVAKQGQYPLAMAYNDRYLNLRDSLESEYRLATNLKIGHEEQQKQMALLEKKEAESKRKTVFIYSLILGIVLLTLLFFALLKGNRQKQMAQLAEKNRLIEAQKVEELLKKQELKSLNAMMLGQEEERKRIARDLHDTLGSMLAMVKNHFKSVEVDIDNLKSSNIKLYKQANKLLDDACEEVRKISQDMASGVLTKFGLVAALEDLSDTLRESKQVDVEFISHGMKNRLPLDMEIGIYRIIQELVSNILKHARASEVSIQILKGKDLLNTIVEDNGTGFNPNTESSGMGLKNVESRVDGFNGKLTIDSNPNKGTTITIDIPLKNIDKND